MKYHLLNDFEILKMRKSIIYKLEIELPP